jgi:hypothetical protein
MADKLETGIRFEPNADISVDWTKLASAVIGTITKGFRAVFVSAEGAGDIVNDLINGVQAFEKEKLPENQAWNLLLLSFCWAIDKTRPNYDISAGDAKKGVKIIIDEMKNLNNIHNYKVNSAFLHNPKSHRLYNDLRDVILNSEIFCKLNKREREEFSHRLDSAFNKAVYDILSNRFGRFNELISVITSPAEAASHFEFQWEAYRRKLQFDFQAKPVFGQEHSGRSLAQLFVPLRCRWIEKVKEDKYRRRVTYLQDELLDWINGNEDDDRVRLIGGGPGSGKSTSLKSIAAKLSENESIDTLFIPLQNIDIDNDLVQSVNDYFSKRTGSAFDSPPLARSNLNSRKKLVLIFDGLDEIARPGEAANEVAGQFAIKLANLMAQISGDGSQFLKVIVSGRLPSFQAIKRHVGGSKPAFEVIGYASYEAHDHIGGVESTAGESFTESDFEIMKIDQRPIWWQKYNYGNINAEVPQALIDRRLRSISNEPLLCYLLVLSGFVGDNWELAADNNNRIYEKLIGDVWARGWGDGIGEVKRQGPGRTLTAPNFLLLMETIALAAWLGGDARVATPAGFEKAVELMKAQDAWANFKSDNGPDVTNLAMNFYLKNSDVTLQGFEFTHKSFGEYLAAKAIIKIASDICDIAKINQESALQAWAKAVGSGSMTIEIWSFIKDQLRLNFHNDPERVKTLRSTLLHLTHLMIEFGISPNFSDCKNWREAESAHRNSEISLWTILNCSTRATEELKSNPVLNEIKLDNRNTYIAEIVNRENILNPDGAVLPKCMSYINLKNVNFFGCNLSGSDFSHSELKDINFNGTHLMNSNFSNSNICDCSFQRSNLDGAFFVNTYFENCDMIDSRLLRCKFENVDGRSLNISVRTLLDCIEEDNKEQEILIPEFIVIPQRRLDRKIRKIVQKRREFKKWINLLQ